MCLPCIAHVSLLQSHQIAQGSFGPFARLFQSRPRARLLFEQTHAEDAAAQLLCQTMVEGALPHPQFQQQEPQLPLPYQQGHEQCRIAALLPRHLLGQELARREGRPIFLQCDFPPMTVSQDELHFVSRSSVKRVKHHIRMVHTQSREVLLDGLP